MSEHSRTRISGHVEGDISGVVAIGERIDQRQVRDVNRTGVDERDIAAVQELFTELSAVVAAEAPDGRREASLQRVDELQQAVTSDKPKLSTMEYVKDWFADNVPKLAGAVMSVIVHPVVVKVVAAGGDMLSAEFRRRFGQ